MLLQIGLYLLASTPTVYALAPLALIVVFIIAAAGLTRGLDIFQFFGVGALLGISQGAGGGGAGKGLKVGTTRGKLQGSIKEGSTVLGVRNVGGKLGRAGKLGVTKAIAKGSEIAERKAQAAVPGASMSIISSSEAKSSSAVKQGFLTMVITSKQRLLPRRSLTGVSQNQLINAEAQANKATTAAARQAQKVVDAKATYDTSTGINFEGKSKIAELGWRFQLWRYSRGAKAKQSFVGGAPLIGFPIIMPRSGYALPLGYAPRAEAAQQRYTQLIEEAAAEIHPARAPRIPITITILGKPPSEAAKVLAATPKRITATFTKAGSYIYHTPGRIASGIKDSIANEPTVSSDLFSWASIKNAATFLGASTKKAVPAYFHGAATVFEKQYRVGKDVKAGSDITADDFYVPGFIVRATAGKLDPETGEVVHTFEVKPWRGRRVRLHEKREEATRKAQDNLD